MLALLRASAPQALALPRRSGIALALLMVAGLVVLSAASLMVAQGTAPSFLTAGASGHSPAQIGGRPEAVARAALPPPLIPSVAKSQAAAAKPKPLPITYERPARTPDARAADRSLGRSLRQAGDIKILEGDIASARLFYERAADAGDARAAFDLGNSFNPSFLDRLGVLGMRGDVVAAARWYRRAMSLGSPDAGKALHTLPR